MSRTLDTSTCFSVGCAGGNDKNYLYGILGLAAPDEELQQEPDLAVDYRATPEEVRTQLAVYLIRSSGDVSFFHGVPRKSSPRWFIVGANLARECIKYEVFGQKRGPHRSVR